MPIALAVNPSLFELKNSSVITYTNSYMHPQAHPLMLNICVVVVPVLLALLQLVVALLTVVLGRTVASGGSAAAGSLF